VDHGLTKRVTTGLMLVHPFRPARKRAGSSDAYRVCAVRRIAVIGAGAMGISLAAIIARSVPTVLVVRDPARRRRIESAGVALSGALESEGRPEVVASIADLADISPIDLAFIATKTTAISAVCDEMRPHLHELPFLVSYQNGIESGRTIVRTLGTTKVIRMVLHYAALLEELGADESGPLVANVTLHEPPHFVGGEGEASTKCAREVAEMLSDLGLPTRFTNDIEREAWRKGLMNAVTNPVTALIRAPLGDLLDSPARPVVERLIDEGLAVAGAAGIEVGDDFREDVFARMNRGAHHLSSMAEDVIAGRVTEITQLNQQIAARGSALGVSTPTHDTIVDLVRAIDWRIERNG